MDPCFSGAFPPGFLPPHDGGLDLGALGLARLPAIAVGALDARLQREHDGSNLLVGELGRAYRKPSALAGGEVATHGLDVTAGRRNVDGRSVTRRQGESS